MFIKEGRPFRPILGAAVYADPWRGRLGCFLAHRELSNDHFRYRSLFFLTFSSPQTLTTILILAFRTTYFTNFGTEASKVIICVHDHFWIFVFLWYLSGNFVFWRTRMLSNQTSVPNPWSPGQQIDEDTSFYPSSVDDSFPKLTLCTYFFSAGKFLTPSRP